MEYMEFLKQYWGVIFIIAFIIGYVYNRKVAIKIAKTLILEAEECTEKYALKNGEEKFAWVSRNGYQMLPLFAKLFISQPLFDMLIQFTFDKLIDWAEKK